MYKYLGWYEWALWLAELALLGLIWVRSAVAAQRRLMGYSLLINLIKFTIIWGDPLVFAHAHYWLMIPEDLLLAAAALGTCSYSFPRYRSVLTWFGPVTMAVPAFFILMIEKQASLIEPAELLATIAVGGSWVMICGCLLLNTSDRQCWGFLGLLTCLLAGAQLHLRLEYSTLGRLGPELGQVLGLSCLWWTWMLGGTVTNRCRSSELHLSL